MPLGPFAHSALPHWSFHLSSSTSGTLLPQDLCKCCSLCLAPHFTSFKSRFRWCFLSRVCSDHPTYNSTVNFLSHSGISDSFLSYSTWVFQKHLSPFQILFISHIYYIYCLSPPLECKVHNKSRAFYSLLHLQYLKKMPDYNRSLKSTYSTNKWGGYKREGRTKWEMHLVTFGSTDTSGAKWLPRQVLFSIKA